ncbi:MAG: J domain-containing protein [Chrysiogenetes bacterium]|nr:J domain-containing protein [Chrysiogenetes bacterium]
MARRAGVADIFNLLRQDGEARRQSMRDLVDSLAPGLNARIEAFERRAREEAARFNSGQNVNDPQAEAMVDMLYAYVKGLEERPGPRSLIRKRGLKMLRKVVVEVELSLLPQRSEAFKLLGVERTESVATIKTKFRTLARRHHPDLPGGDHRKMQELNEAYTLIMRMKGEN